MKGRSEVEIDGGVREVRGGTCVERSKRQVLWRIHPTASMSAEDNKGEADAFAVSSRSCVVNLGVSGVLGDRRLGAQAAGGWVEGGGDRECLPLVVSTPFRVG